MTKTSFQKTSHRAHLSKNELISAAQKQPSVSEVNAERLLSWVEVDLKAIEHNLKEIRRWILLNKMPLSRKNVKLPLRTPEVMAVVKADSYGHGMMRVALYLDRLGINFFAVSDVAEGIRLREMGLKKNILLLESSLPVFADQIIEYGLTPTICTIELALRLDRLAHARGKKIPVHIKIDTGMGRLGVWHEEALVFIEKMQGHKNLNLEGIYTHFPSADHDKAFTRAQLRILESLQSELKQRNIAPFYVHADNSMGLLGYKSDLVNLVRPGLMLYGQYPHPRLKKKVDLRSALSVYSRVIYLKKIKKGRSISYGRTFVAKKVMTVATIPLGYSDGYPRVLSNKSIVLINGARCPVLGRVTMDQIVVDVSGVSGVQLGTKVTVLGVDREEKITADQLASQAQTISYEILCNLGNRLPRLYK